MPGMSEKNIKSVLRKKFSDYLSSIEDETLRCAVERNAIITGGAIASMLIGEPVNDYDVYFTDKATTLAVAQYYAARFRPGVRNGVGVSISVEEFPDRVSIKIQSAGIASETEVEEPYQYFEARPENEAADFVGEVMDGNVDGADIIDKNDEIEAAALNTDGKPKYRPVFMSTNAITLSDRVQVVLRFFGEPDDIHENYDFVHCTNYWRSSNGDLVLRDKAIISLLSRELRYVGSKYPVCSIIRLRKFLARGWRINAGQILKILMQVAALDLTDPKVLQDQLTGVDAAYFVEILAKVNEKDPEKINSAYLIEIIDRMF